MMTFGSLFAGIGGIDLGLERAGMACKWQVEIDDYATAVLAKHWPDVPRFRDVRDVGASNLVPVDLICGGFPCQDVSLAGKRAGLSGTRSTLWDEFHRIICELRPRWVLAENVPGLLSSDDGRFFAKVLRNLAESGYDAEWNVLSAASIGAPHKRARVCLLAYSSRCGVGGQSTSDQNARMGLASSGEGLAEGIAREDVAFSEFERRSRSWWETEPDVGRVAHGVPFRVDRLRCLGNAVVPQWAEYWARYILAAEHNA